MREHLPGTLADDEVRAGVEFRVETSSNLEVENAISSNDRRGTWSKQPVSLELQYKLSMFLC